MCGRGGAMCGGGKAMFEIIRCSFMIPPQYWIQCIWRLMEWCLNTRNTSSSSSSSSSLVLAPNIVMKKPIYTFNHNRRSSGTYFLASRSAANDNAAFIIHHAEKMFSSLFCASLLPIICLIINVELHFLRLKSGCSSRGVFTLSKAWISLAEVKTQLGPPC